MAKKPRRNRTRPAASPSTSDTPESRFAGAAAQIRRVTGQHVSASTRQVITEGGASGRTDATILSEAGLGSTTPDSYAPAEPESREYASNGFDVRDLVEGHVAKARRSDIFWLLALLVALFLGFWAIMDNGLDSVRDDLREAIATSRDDVRRDIDRIERVQEGHADRLRTLETQRPTADPVTR